MAAVAPVQAEWVPFGDDELIKARFEEEGVVVVSEVLAAAELASALEELWTSPRLLNREGGVRRDDETSWSSQHWPQQDGGRNFLASSDPFQDIATWQLAQHPKIVALLRLLYGEDVFLETVGRWGVMRPTRQHPEWRTDDAWLHWDQSPYTEPGFVRIQTIVCLTAQTATSGGFLAVPGFHKLWHKWALQHPEGSVVIDGNTITADYGRNRPFPVPPDDPLQEQTVRILAPAGAVILWDSRIPHQNYPNTSSAEFRVVHYQNWLVRQPAAYATRRRQLAQKLIIYQVLGIDTPFWPHHLTPLGREHLALPALDREAATAPVDPKLAAAIRLAHQAGQSESAGDLDRSIQLFAQATRSWPMIDEWYEALFGF